jgi:signal transduction histidine kinase
MDKYFDRFINIATTDPDDSRRRSILNILLAGVGVISIAGLITAVIVNPRVNFTIIVISLISIGGVAIIYFINLRWSGRTASIIFLGLLTVICAFSDTPLEVAAGRALFVFTIPIIMASILLTPWSSFVFGVISSIIISVFANSVGRIPNSPAILGYMLVALVSWLSSRSLEQALKELRVINANLDQIVVERTQALAESLERERLEAGRNKAILNSIGDGVIVFDKKWNATMVNPAVKSMLDIPLDLILNKNFHEFIEHPRLAAQGRNLLSAMIEHDTQPMGFRIEWGEKTLSVGAAQVYDSRGENLGTVTVFRDFTREAEVERLKSTFVAIVSHELRTPLNAILGYAEMFKESVYGPMTDKQIKMAAGIMKNTDQLLGLISDLLDEAQMEAGQLTITNAPLKPAELLETLHSLLDRTASDKRLRLTSEIDDDLPETLSGDADRLQQILTNLVNNSIKFTEHGEICVRLRRTDDAKWGFEVEDTGRGIPEADIPYIFETFRQVEGSTTRVHGGVGLGLAIVKQLVNLMNGEVKVESKVDVGTKFTVILPLAVP